MAEWTLDALAMLVELRLEDPAVRAQLAKAAEDRERAERLESVGTAVGWRSCAARGGAAAGRLGLTRRAGSFAAPPERRVIFALRNTHRGA